MQCRDLIPVAVLSGCSQLDLLLNSLVGGGGAGSGRGHLSVGWHSMNTELWVMAAPAAERKSSALTLL